MNWTVINIALDAALDFDDWFLRMFANVGLTPHASLIYTKHYGFPALAFLLVVAHLLVIYKVTYKRGFVDVDQVFPAVALGFVFIITPGIPFTAYCEQQTNDFWLCTVPARATKLCGVASLITGALYGAYIGLRRYNEMKIKPE